MYSNDAFANDLADDSLLLRFLSKISHLPHLCDLLQDDGLDIKGIICHGTAEETRQRAFLCTDWIVRTALPIQLRLLAEAESDWMFQITEFAKFLGALEPITDTRTAANAKGTIASVMAGIIRLTSPRQPRTPALTGKEKLSKLHQLRERAIERTMAKSLLRVIDLGENFHTRYSPRHDLILMVEITTHAIAVTTEDPIATLPIEYAGEYAADVADLLASYDSRRIDIAKELKMLFDRLVRVTLAADMAYYQK